MATVTIVIVLVLLAVTAISIARTAPTRLTVRARSHGSARATGLPPGRVVYADADGTARPLVARGYPLLGKPDYVVLTPDGHRIPVEIKSARSRGRPRHEDVLQVATYLMILDDLYDPAPRYGLLRYANATFEVPYTRELRDEVLGLLAEMQALDGGDGNTTTPGKAETGAPAGHPSVPTCCACAFRAICEDAAVY